MDVLKKKIDELLTQKDIPYSFADNDLRYLGNNQCCCGDRLVHKPTTFNTTAMCQTYGVDYSLESVKAELEAACVGDCKCCQYFASNRQEGCKTVSEFYDKRFDRKSSPFSPKFQYQP